MNEEAPLLWKAFAKPVAHTNLETASEKLYLRGVLETDETYPLRNCHRPEEAWVA